MPVPNVAHLQQLTQSVASSKESSNPQQTGQVKYSPKDCLPDVHKGSVVSSAGTSTLAAGSENLSTMLAAAPPKAQRRILGEHVYHLVSHRKPDVAAKVTGMLLEMDKAKHLSLLESPEFLAAMVEEAVEVIKLSKTEVSNQDSHS